MAMAKASLMLQLLPACYIWVLHSPLLHCAHSADAYSCYCRCHGTAAVGACSGSKSMVLPADGTAAVE